MCATKLRPINLQNGFVFQQLPPPLMCFVWRRKQISGQLCDFFKRFGFASAAKVHFVQCHRAPRAPLQNFTLCYEMQSNLP